MIKTISLLSRRAGMSYEDFVLRWRDEHAPLALKVEGLRRYVLSPVSAQPQRADITAHGIEVDGVAELWYDDRAAMERAAASPEMRALRAHGAEIIGAITNMLTEEIVVIGPETQA